MALTTPSSCVTPRAAYTVPKHPQHAHVPRHSLVPVMPCESTLEPCPKWPDGPVHPLSQGLVDCLPLRAEPLGDCLAPDRKLSRPRLTADRRQAEAVEGLRFPLTPPLAPFVCPTPKRNEARLVRVQCAMQPVEAFPQVAQKLLGVLFVLEADHDIVTVPHDHDVAPCVPVPPLRRPQVQDIVQGKGRQERTGHSPYKVANFFFRGPHR
jgi:hypothetical protein